MSPGKGPRTDSGGDRYKQRAVLLRVLVYVFVTHFIAGFITLLFYLGQHASK